MKRWIKHLCWMWEYHWDFFRRTLFRAETPTLPYPHLCRWCPLGALWIEQKKCDLSRFHVTVVEEEKGGSDAD